MVAGRPGHLERAAACGAGVRPGAGDGRAGVVAVLSQTLPPRSGQEALVWPVMLGSGALSVAIQLLHNSLIVRTLRHSDG